MGSLEQILGIRLADLEAAKLAALKDAVETFEITDPEFFEAASRIVGRPDLRPSSADRAEARERRERAAEMMWLTESFGAMQAARECKAGRLARGIRSVERRRKLELDPETRVLFGRLADSLSPPRDDDRSVG